MNGPHPMPRQITPRERQVPALREVLESACAGLIPLDLQLERLIDRLERDR